MSKQRTSGHVFIALSLDGFIARKNGELDWLMKQKTQGEDHGYDSFMESVDGLIMGRKSFQKVLSFGIDWPYHKPVVVLSRTLTPQDIPEELRERVFLSSEEPRSLLERLHQEGWKRAYVDGGKLIQSFLREGLIADFHLSRMPILIGSGAPLFGELAKDLDLEHLGTRTFPSGVVESRYAVQQEPTPQSSENS